MLETKERVANGIKKVNAQNEIWLKEKSSLLRGNQCDLTEYPGIYYRDFQIYLFNLITFASRQRRWLLTWWLRRFSISHWLQWFVFTSREELIIYKGNIKTKLDVWGTQSSYKTFFPFCLNKNLGLFTL